MTVDVLWTHESDYLRATVQAIAATGRPVRMFTFGVSRDAPFQLRYSDNVELIRGEAGSPPEEVLRVKAGDVALVAGWHVPAYRKYLSRSRNRTARILSMDNQWRATGRQALGVAWFRTYGRTLFDACAVPGPRQERFAKALGFNSRQIINGALPCNHSLFRDIVPGRSYRTFYANCRLSPEKGIGTLLEAYSSYSEALGRDAWQLRISGAGEMPRRIPLGASFLGFLNPDEVASQMRTASAFVLASRFEPWGVALHEAAAAGLPIICTNACGAVGTFVVNGRNGVVVDAHAGATALSEAMTDISRLTDSRWQEMSNASRYLAGTATPEIFAADVVSRGSLK